MVGKDGGPEDGQVAPGTRSTSALFTQIRLGLTVHAGEDFADPMTGLRNIWEAAVNLDLGEGDRIGHALAAGLKDRETVLDFFERRAKTRAETSGSSGPGAFQ